MTPDEIRAIVREEVQSARREDKRDIKEWLDDQFSTFGRWSVMALTSAIFFALIYFVLKMNGFSKQ